MSVIAKTTLLSSLFITTAFCADDWERNKRDLLWNFNNMYNPCVVETGGEYRYKMWFFGWAASGTNLGIPGCDAIFHARSKDLLNWEVYSGEDTWDATMNPTLWIPVLHASERWYEAWHVGDPSVVFQDGRFTMAYSATSKHFDPVEGYPATMVQCLMGAESEDGIHWRKTDQPLLICADDRETPVPNPKRIGDFHRPCLRYENSTWRLWFDYWAPGKGCCMGYAENPGGFMQKDGFKFRHDLMEPLLVAWPNPEVVHIGGRYFCFSDPPGYPIQEGQSGWMSRQLCEAVSDDGLHWTRLDYIPPDDDADACHVPQTFIAEIEGKKWLYLFYSTQVGYKRNDGKYHFEYDRIRAMRRPIELGKN